MLVVTSTIVFSLDNPESPAPPRSCLHADGIRVAARSGDISVAALDRGALLFHTAKGEECVETELPEPIDSLLIESPHAVALLIGTEGAHLFRFSHHQRTAHRIHTFDQLACRAHWDTPWGGPPSVRTLASTTDGWVYADIHVGSIMRSSDRGESWEPVNPQLDRDVHQVATCPTVPDRVYANTAHGVYVSSNRGNTWDHRAKDLDNRYGRAIAVHPHHPDLLLASVSDGPHGANVHAQLFRSSDCGRHWQHISGDFPASSRKNINTGHICFTADGTAWACVDNLVFIGRENGSVWEPFWEAPDEVRMLAP